ncbi:ECF transporter S component [Candidatus Clostridium radicumherbarum]|uniref:Riboflavin transporter n=1 Tax=Candidatus Clostridium radicumherbarum TaxID=3381662 RepID=A0ABW8TPA6_9CLOT
MKNNKLNKLIKISLLGCIAFILMYIEIPLPIFPSFLRIDIGDLPALLGAFAFGPMAGVLVELVKNILYAIFKGNTALIGESANFLIGSVLVFVAGIIYKKKKTKNGALLGLLAGGVIMTIAASILNYFVLLPLYETVLGFKISAVVGMGAAINHNVKDLNSFIIWIIVPYNILKVFVVSVVTLAVYKSVSPILHQK